MLKEPTYFIFYLTFVNVSAIPTSSRIHWDYPWSFLNVTIFFSLLLLSLGVWHDLIQLGYINASLVTNSSSWQESFEISLLLFLTCDNLFSLLLRMFTVQTGFILPSFCLGFSYSSRLQNSLIPTVLGLSCVTKFPLIHNNSQFSRHSFVFLLTKLWYKTVHSL